MKTCLLCRKPEAHQNHVGERDKELFYNFQILHSPFLNKDELFLYLVKRRLLSTYADLTFLKVWEKEIKRIMDES